MLLTAFCANALGHGFIFLSKGEERHIEEKGGWTTMIHMDTLHRERELERPPFPLLALTEAAKSALFGRGSSRIVSPIDNLPTRSCGH